MNLSNSLREKTFAIYGLGATGVSIINFFKKNKINNYFIWDDNIKFKKVSNLKCNKKIFIKKLDTVDYILVSPGIDINKSSIKKKLRKHIKKIITDLDLLYLQNIDFKSIVVTGTNGKSTTCKMLEHLLKKNKFSVKLGGNIGKPVLDLNISKKDILVLEASSFQLAYSKFIKPNYAMILNITTDHLDWHKNFINYSNSKFKIFSLQKKTDFSFLDNSILFKKYKKRKFKGKLKFIKKNKYGFINKKIKNNYLKSDGNIKNMNFVYELSLLLKINENRFINAMNSFQGLEHRNEIFYKKKNITYINDSKATSFEASKTALKSHKNIFWILGGIPKAGDKIDIQNLKKNIVKCFIFGKNTSHFQKQLINNVSFVILNSLKDVVLRIIKEVKNTKKPITVLLSPTGSSFDQFKNFVQRGNYFKKLIKLNAK